MSEESVEKKIKRRRLAKLEDYRVTFNNPAGRRVLYDLIDAHGVMTTNFHENPHVLAAREGERSVVLRILQILKTDPQQMEKTIEEAHEHVSQKRII